MHEQAGQASCHDVMLCQVDRKAIDHTKIIKNVMSFGPCQPNPSSTQVSCFLKT